MFRQTVWPRAFIESLHSLEGLTIGDIDRPGERRVGRTASIKDYRRSLGSVRTLGDFRVRQRILALNELGKYEPDGTARFPEAVPSLARRAGIVGTDYLLSTVLF
jgi:hypothetical protein